MITIFEDSSESDSLEQNLQAAVKVLENTQLDFSRYGDTLFEVLFAGGRMASGGTLAPEANKLDTNVRLCITLLSRADVPSANRKALSTTSTNFCAGSCCLLCLQGFIGKLCALMQVLASAPNREAILPYVKVFQTLLRCVSQSHSNANLLHSCLWTA